MSIDWKAEYEAEHEKRLKDKERIAQLEAQLSGFAADNCAKIGHGIFRGPVCPACLKEKQDAWTARAKPMYALPCCRKEKRNMDGGCDNCGDPCY